MSHEYKVCPSCLEEFTLVASECSDCKVELVFPDAIEPEEERAEFPPISELECVRVGPLPWTRALSDALERAEIPHRVERETRSEAEGGVDPRKFDGETIFGTWVKSEDLEAAKELDRSVFATIDPEHLEAHDASEDEACPACGASLSVDALACPDCGLSFG